MRIMRCLDPHTPSSTTSGICRHCTLVAMSTAVATTTTLSPFNYIGFNAWPLVIDQHSPFFGSLQKGQNYFVVFPGVFFAATTGTYAFQATFDDGSVVFLDGSLIVNNDAVQSATTVTNS